MSLGAETEEEQFGDTPRGWAARLKAEFKAARDALKPWHDDAEKALKAYLDEREGTEAGETHWNLYTSDTQTQEAMLYGKTPQVVVSRRFADAKDDLARVAALVQERVLNADIESDDDTYCEALALANMDRRQAGCGAARVRYEKGEEEVEEGAEAITRPHPETGEPMELAPAVPDVSRRPNEQVPTDWVHWRDILWGSARAWHQVPWVAFAADMSRKAFATKFGQKVADQVQFARSNGQRDEPKAPSPWSRVRVWEVWVKEERQVFFYVENYAEVLTPEGVPAEANGGVKDPLGLSGFFPCPKPLFANLTNTKLVPKTDYALAKDLYEEINNLSTRIRMLQSAVKVRGAYDKATPALGRILDGDDNSMVPVDSWAMFAEKGGIKGVVDWFPLEQVVNALSILREYRAEQVDAVRQITGMSDIMRGQGSEPGRTATSDRITAKFGSVRMQRAQDEFARFASDLQKLRAEVMAKHFEPSTYLARCNCENTPDAPLAPQAVELLKSDFAKFRIEVKPEALSLTDFDALKQERTEVIAAIGSYIQVAGPLAAQSPSIAPMLLQILQWMIAGLRGASEIEGVLDQAVSAAQQAAQQPQPAAQQDPKLAVVQAKGQIDMQKAQLDHSLGIEKLKAEVFAERAKQQAQTEENIKEDMARANIKATHQAMQPAPQGVPR